MVLLEMIMMSIVAMIINKIVLQLKILAIMMTMVMAAAAVVLWLVMMMLSLLGNDRN